MSTDRIFAQLSLMADETFEYGGFIVGLINAEKMRKFVGKNNPVVVVRIPEKGWTSCKGGKEEFDRIVRIIKTNLGWVN